ncbi:MAG: SUMF1/EgtB/PvdO family nonheme iron enzyme [Spirochaetales bacterium]|nr:SUMF1/EgtB/PvdO family nonheme iron enzyme [Spirochaetales bacterium]
MRRKITIIIMLFILLSAQAYSQDRFALVIGNSNYAELGKLKNPLNDAKDIAAALKKIGFEVELFLDADLAKMETGVVNLGRRLSGKADSIGLFYFAGHGVQSNGQNFLIPSGAQIASESFLRTKSLSAQAVLDELRRAGNRLNTIILDACRDNPFGWSRGGSRGLSVVGSQPPGSIIVYATSAGSTAGDGNGRNGLFTSELLKNLTTEGLEINQVFRKTGAGVQKQSGGKQIPAVYSQFFDEVYLAGGASSAARIETLPQTGLNNVRLPEGFVLVRGGTFQMGSNDTDCEKPVHSVTLPDFAISRYEVTQGLYKKIMGGNPSDTKWGIGDNNPVNCVSWYDAVKFCNKLSESEGRTPAYTISGTNVSWDRNADGYRLPTEAEWEYVAKGGNSSRNYTYAGSGSIGNVAWYRDNSGNRTHPVGQKQANELGLYDMTGNVWEWCWDWYGSYQSGSVSYPVGASSGSYRVLRGGSWYGIASYCRAAIRHRDAPDDGFSGYGFRLVLPQEY